MNIKNTLYRYLLAALLIVALSPVAAQGQSWYNTSWNYRKAITIDASKVGTGPHTNFPVLIDITDADLAARALATGNDILFTSSNGTTKLSHQIESYTSASGDLVAWVEIPSLPSTANTVIYMYYGNAAAANQQNVTGTWDANYRGVYHLNGAFTDATVNAYNGTNTTTTAATGKISNGRGFLASNGADYITVSGMMGSPANITLSGWVYLTTYGASGCDIISLGDKVVLRMTSTGIQGLAYNGTAWTTTSTSSVNYAGAWRHIAYTFSNGAQRIYVDGVQVGTSSTAAAITYTGLGANTIIGRHGNGGTTRDFTGTIDEVRVASAARSAGWILTEYNNQNSPSTFYYIQSCESKPPTVVTPVVYCQNAAASQLTATGSNLLWGTGASGSVGGTGTLATATYIDGSWTNQRTNFTTTTGNVTINSVDIHLPAWQAATGLVLGIFNSSGTLIGSSSTSTTFTAGSTATKITVPIGYTIAAAGNYSIGVASGYGNVGGDAPSFPMTEGTGTISVTGKTGSYRCFNNIQFTRPGSGTAPTPSTSVVGSTNYIVTQTLNGCVSDAATIAVNVTGSVGTPTAITVAAGTQPTCQLTNGTTTTTYGTTASNSTSFNWSLSNAAAGTISSAGVVTWASGFSGSVSIRVTANGCNGPSAMVTRAVTITPSVGTPVFTSGATSIRCQAAGTTTYGATATNSTGITYSLDATSLAAGNSIVAATGAVTFASTWAGTSVISASAAGCNGPTTATHTVTTSAPVAANHLDYSNGLHGVLCATAAEGGTVSLTAPAGTHFIYVGFASYGTPNGSCGSFSQSTCHAATSQNVAEGYLLGNSSALIPATNGVFGDPCQGTVKRMYVAATYGQSICAGTAPGTITGTAPTGGTGSYTYYWERSIAGPSSGFAAAPGTNNAQHYSPGVLNQTSWFRRTVTSGGCSDVSPAIQITVSTPGSATISYAGSPYCGSAAADTVVRTGTTGGTYSSAAGLALDTLTGQIAPASSTPGTYTVTYRMVNGGCVSTATTTVTVSAPPSATISYAGSPYCSSSGTAAVTRTGTAGGTYSSTAGLSINASTGAVNLAASTAGTYTVTYTIPASAGCPVFTTTASITVTQQPMLTASYTGNPYCGKAGIAHPTATVFQGAYGYLTSTPGVVMDIYAGVDLAATPPGTHTITYTVPATGGCPLYTSSFNIVISAPSSATISYPGNPLCSSGGVASVSRTGTAGGTYVSAAGLSINGTTGAITPSASTPGTYAVHYIMVNGGCTDTATASVTVNAPLTAAVSIAPSTTNAVCAGTGITFTATPANGGSSPAYQWKVNGTNAGTNAATFSSAALANGDVVTCVMTSAAGCVTGSPATSNAVAASIIPRPSMTSPGTRIICSGNGTGINLSASLPASFNWTVGAVTGGITGASGGAGDTINQVLSNPGSTAGTVQYLVTPVATVQAYTATVAAGNQAYSDRLGSVFTANGPVDITALGIFDDNGDGLVNTLQVGIVRNSDGAVVAGPISMTGSGDPLEGGFRMRAITPVTLPAGTYTVVSVGHSASDRNGNATISGTGTALHSGGGLITFNSASYGGAGMGLPSTPYATNNVFHAGSFRFSTGCAGSQATITVTVNPQHAATISYAGSPYCSSSGTASVTQTGTTGGTYSSTSGLSINAATGDVNLAASTAGAYTVTYTVAASGGCAAFSTTASITITTQPYANGYYPGSPYCQSAGGMVYPTATILQGATGSISSSPGLVINAYGGVDVGASTPGTYTVTYTVPAGGGCATYTTSSNLTISAPGAATIAYPGSPLCTSGGMAAVSHTGTTGGTYVSSAGLSIQASTGAITPAASTPGTYTVYVGSSRVDLQACKLEYSIVSPK